MSLKNSTTAFLLVVLSVNFSVGQNACDFLNFNELNKVLSSNGMQFDKFLPNNKGRESVCNISLKNDAPSLQLSIKPNDKFETFSSLFPQYITKLIKDGELISKMKHEGGRRYYEKIENTATTACFHFSSDYAKLVWITVGDNLYSLKFNNSSLDKESAKNLLLNIAKSVK